MAKCYECRKIIPDGLFRCIDHLTKNTLEVDDRRVRGMTDWERMKLGFYRSDKKWKDHIRTRQIVYDKTGKKDVVSVDSHGNIRAIPNQPRHLWPKSRMVALGK